MSQLKNPQTALIFLLLTHNQIPTETVKLLIYKYGDDALKMITSPFFQPTFDGVLTLGENWLFLKGQVDETILCKAAIVGTLFERQEKSGSIYFNQAAFKRSVKKRLCNLPNFTITTDFDILYDQALCQAVSEKWVALLDFPQKLICLYALRKMEGECVNKIAAKLKTPQKYSDDFIQTHMATLQHSALNLEQKSVIEMVLTHRFSIVIGKPGTGKTTVLNQLVRTIEQANSYSKIALCAYTGKAANRMAQATGREAQTIHHLLRMNVGQVEMPQKIKNLDYVIVDEVSMLTLDIFHKLIMSLSPETTILMLGDPNQLPSIGCGMILDDCVNSQRVPVVRLNQVYRQKGDSGISLFAEHIRGDNNDNADDVVIGFFENVLPNFKDMSLIEADDSDYLSLTKQAVKNLISKGFSTNDIQILTAGNEGRNALNQELRPIFNPQPNANPTAPFWVGDRVMQLKNDYITEMTNGEIGTVAAVKNTIVSVEFPSLKFGKSVKKVDYVLAVPEEDRSITLAYAITVHKSQGSEFPAVVLQLGSKDSSWVSKNLLYTAATRARKELILVSTQNQIETCMGRGVKRNTGLQLLLEEKSKAESESEAEPKPEAEPEPEPQEETFEQFSFDGF